MANKLKNFRIWNVTGKPENIQADRVEFDPPLDEKPRHATERVQRTIKFFIGRKRRIVKDAVMFTEISEPVIVQIPRHEIQDLDEE